MKKVGSVFAIMLTMISSIVFAANTFTDINSSHWAYKAVDSMTEKGIVSGYPEGNFQPNNSITRAEFAKLVVYSLDLFQEGTRGKYDDVSPNYWAYDYANIIRPYFVPADDNQFLPSKPVTREEVAYTMVKALKLNNSKYDIKTIDRFTDKFDVSEGYEKYVAIIAENGIMIGNADGTFSPKGELTRAEVTQLLFNTMSNSKFDKGIVGYIKVPSIEDKIYNGETQKVSNGTGYTVSGNTKAKKAGEYKVKLNLKKGYRWSDGTKEPKEVVWSIIGGVSNNEDLEKDVVLVETPKTTTNKTQKPATTKKAKTTATPKPTATPTQKPKAKPTQKSTTITTQKPTTITTQKPTAKPTQKPTTTPTQKPTATPTQKPTAMPTQKPTGTPTQKPTATPTPKPTATPTQKPTAMPTQKPTATPTQKPTATPTQKSTATPTQKPTAMPTQKPTATPTQKSTATPTPKPTATKAVKEEVIEIITSTQAPKPTAVPTQKPTAVPTAKPTAVPTPKPTAVPTPKPTAVPTPKPTAVPTSKPTAVPTPKPTATPTPKPSSAIVEKGPMRISPKYETRDTVVAEYKISPASSSTTDVSSTINTTLSECFKNGGGTVWLESGIYYISSPINIPTLCTLRGDYQDPDSYSGTLEYGTIFVVDVDKINYSSESDMERKGLFNLSDNAGLIGVTIYYKNQSIGNLKAQPWSIYYKNGMCPTIKNVTLINSYIGIGRSYNDTLAHETLTIDNVKGTVLSKGILIHNSADVGTITGLTLKPEYWSNANISKLDPGGSKPTRSEIVSKSKAIGGAGLILTDVEWSQFVNVSISGFKYGIYIPNASTVKTRYMGSGSFYNLKISDCTRGIMVESGVYSKSSSEKYSMIDYRWGYLISNSSIEGSEFSIYTLSPEVNGKRGSIKLNDVSLRGRTGGDGAIVFFSTEKNAYSSVYEKTHNGDATGIINNTNSFKNLNVKKTTKTTGTAFKVVEAGSSASTINKALSDVGSSGGGVVYLKPGQYTLDAALNVPSNVELKGAASLSGRYAASGSRILGTVINIKSSISAVSLNGNNSGVSGIFFLYPSNIQSLNTSSKYTGYPSTIVSGNTSNIYIYNVTIGGATHGIGLRNCNSFYISNVITGVLESAIAVYGGSNGIITNCLQNATVISRNSLYSFNKDNLFNNIFIPNTREHLQYIYINGVQNISIQNCFSYGGWVFFASYGSTSYLVNVGSDGMSSSGRMFYYSKDSASNSMIINAMRYNGTSCANNNPTSNVGIYNRANCNDGNILEADMINKKFK